MTAAELFALPMGSELRDSTTGFLGVVVAKSASQIAIRWDGMGHAIFFADDLDIGEKAAEIERVNFEPIEPFILQLKNSHVR